MLKLLRWKLTFTYIGASLALILLIGGGSYYVLERYLRSEVDLSLRYGMVGQFQLFGIEMPGSLEDAELKWAAQQPGSSLNIVPINIGAGLAQPAEDDEGDSDESYLHELEEHGYGSQLISIFTMPLDAAGNVIFNPNPYPLPMTPDQDAFTAALENGSDFRTVNLPTGERVRLLTYRTGSQDSPAAFQLGRVLVEQELVLRNLLFGILTIGGISMVIVGLGSWLLAGRTILPAQTGMDQQQAFVANASHELRTPLTLIRASTEMSLRKSKNAEVNQLLQNVIDEADYMNRLVDDLLLLTRLDAEQIKLDIQPIDITELLTEAARMVESFAVNKEISIKIDQINKTLQADEIRIRQVLLIILDNAINYTSDGGKILLSAREQGGQIIIEVEDNGKGISPVHLPKIFERFYQAEANFNSNQRSNGLGLSIAKNLIELHHGQITAKSIVGKGTTITIQLPVV